MKIAVLVSGRGSNLQALIKNLHGFDVEIVGVVSDNEDAPALKHARTADIPTASFAEASYDGREARDLAIADWLDENQAELVVLAGYMALLSDSFVARFRDRIINVHPSLLPAFPGTRAVEMAVAAGVKVFGVTVHLVDEGIDTGPILLQRAVELDGAGAARALDDVGLPARAVGHVAAQDAFVGHEPGGLDEVLGDGEAAFVIHAGRGDGGPVELRLQDMDKHGDGVEKAVLRAGAAKNPRTRPAPR